MVRQCCVCKKVNIDGRWIYARLSQLESEDISHGYCDDCYKKQIHLIHRHALRHWWQRWVHRLFCFG